MTYALTTFAGGILGNVWATLLLAAWGAAAWAGVRDRLFPAWAWPERLALTYAIAVAGLTSSIAIFARQLDLGFYGGGTGSLLLGLGVFLWLVRRSGRATAKPTARTERRGARFWWILALGNVPVLLIAVFNHSMDWTVHYWNVAAIQNDWLPLPYPTYPDMTVAYHYAVDLLAAVVGVALPIDREWIFDGLTLAAWNTCALLGSGLVLEIGTMSRTRGLAFVLAFSLLGGGLMWLLFPLAHTVAAPSLEKVGLDPAVFIAGTWGPLPVIAGEVLNFPVLHYFFNLPFAVGLPLCFAALHLYAECAKTCSRPHVVTCALVLGALSLAHVAIFFVLGLAFGLYAVLDAIGRRTSVEQRSTLLLPMAIIGLGALALAALQGGVFSLQDGGFSGRSIRWFVGLRAEGPLSLLIYWLAIFGVSGVIGVGGAFRSASQGRTVGMLLALIAVVGMCVPYVAWFTTSPVDNFKFFTIASIALGLLAAAPVDSAAQKLSAGVGSVLIALLMLASVGTPLLHVVARLMTAPDYLLALHAEAPRTELRPSRAWSEENAMAQRLAALMGRDDLLLVLPPNHRETPVLLALAGRFGAQASYSGYPGITLSESRQDARNEWLRRAQALERDSLCEPSGLWIYVREDRLEESALEVLQRLTETGWLRLAHRSDAEDGRRSVFEACPHGQESLR